MITCWLYIPVIFLLSIPATPKLYVLPDDSSDRISVVPLPLVVILVSSLSLRTLMMYLVRQIEWSEGGDQVRLTELSLSATTDNPIGEVKSEINVIVYIVT